MKRENKTRDMKKISMKMLLAMLAAVIFGEQQECYFFILEKCRRIPQRRNESAAEYDTAGNGTDYRCICPGRGDLFGKVEGSMSSD